MDKKDKKVSNKIKSLIKVSLSIIIVFLIYVLYTYEIPSGMPSKYKGTIIEDLYTVNVKTVSAEKKSVLKEIMSKWIPNGTPCAQLLGILQQANFELIHIKQSGDGNTILLFRSDIATIYYNEVLSTLFWGTHAFLVEVAIMDCNVISCEAKTTVTSF